MGAPLKTPMITAAQSRVHRHLVATKGGKFGLQAQVDFDTWFKPGMNKSCLALF